MNNKQSTFMVGAKNIGRFIEAIDPAVLPEREECNWRCKKTT